MSSPWRSGPKIGGLDALPEIVDLAKEVLAVEQLERVDEMAMTLLTRRKQRRQVRWELVRMVPLKPSRPLMYLKPIIMQLPNATRDVIRYLGDYIDLLTKEMTYEFLNGKARFSSLGINAKKLEEADAVPRDLVDKLQRYNSFLYTPGKHDFSLPPEGRKHGFTCKEAVLTIYVSTELGERIKVVSKLAREAVEKDDLYMIGGRWGPHRVKYAGES
jgi:hypothetical protein